MLNRIRPRSRSGWRIYTAVRVAALLALTATALWLRFGSHAQPDAKMWVVMIAFLVLLFAGPWRYDEYNLTSRGS